MADYGFVTGVFIHPLAGQVQSDRPQGGRVTFFPQSVQHLSTPPRTVGSNPESMVLSATGKVSGWLIAGVYNVQVTFVDGVQLPSFYVHVLDTYTEASPLDLTLAAPPAPGPNTVVVVSEAERVLAEAAASAAALSAAQAEDAAQRAEPFIFRNAADLANAPAGPAVFLFDPNNLPIEPLPPVGLWPRPPYLSDVSGTIRVMDYGAILPGVKQITFTQSSEGSISPQLQANAYLNYPTLTPAFSAAVQLLTPVLAAGQVPIGNSAGNGWDNLAPSVGQSVGLSTLVQRDVNGRAAFNTPAAAADAATKGYVDDRNPALVATGPYYDFVGQLPGKAAGTARATVQGSPTSMANFVIVRDPNGRAQVATPSATADIATKGYVDTGGWATVPTSATAAGTAGQRAYDGSYLYICVATNTWRRVAIAAW